MLAVGIGLTLLFPSHIGPLPDGLRTPILAFELARTREEVETMFGAPQPSERSAWQRAMDRGNYADFVFLVAYGAFFVTFSRALSASGDRVAELGRSVAPLPSIMDVLENWQLLAITRALGGDYAEALSRLQLFTWCKWFLLAVLCATWIPGMWSRGALGRVGAVLAALTLAATALAFFTRGIAAELMVLGSGLTSLAALVVAFRSAKSEARAPAPLV
jgi:hypothetical protein